MDHSILSTSIAKYMLRTNYTKQPSIKIYNNWIKDSNTSINDINTCIWCLNLIERSLYKTQTIIKIKYRTSGTDGTFSIKD